MGYFSRYGMMRECWALDPCNRPTFSKLTSFMSDQLTDREEKVGQRQHILGLESSHKIISEYSNLIHVFHIHQ